MAMLQSSSRILLILLATILAKGEGQRKDFGYFQPIIFPDDELPPRERISRDSTNFDQEYYSPDYTKKFFFNTQRNCNSSIVFPSPEMEDDGIPPRFSRPSVDDSGVVSFRRIPPQQMAGSVPGKIGWFGPITSTISSVEVNLGVEQVLINERLDAFVEWLTQNNLTGDLPASEAFEAESGNQSDFTLSNGGVLSCPPGQVRRGGSCEQVAQF